MIQSIAETVGGGAYRNVSLQEGTQLIGNLFDYLTLNLWLKPSAVHDEVALEEATRTTMLHAHDGFRANAKRNRKEFQMFRGL